MHWLLDAIVVLTYFIIGAGLSTKAHRHMRDNDFPIWDTPLYNPELFTAEGDRLRRRALKFWMWGGICVLIYFHPHL